MATLDIFNDDAFSLSSLSQTIVDIPRVPTQLGDEGLFNEYGINSLSMMIERQGAALKRVTVLGRNKASLGIDELAAVSGDGVFAEGLQLLHDLGAGFGAGADIGLDDAYAPLVACPAGVAVGKSGRKGGAHKGHCHDGFTNRHDSDSFNIECAVPSLGATWMQLLHHGFECRSRAATPS